MAVGIEKSLEVFADLQLLAVSGVELAKEFRHGVGLGALLGSLGKLKDLAKSVEELLKDVPAALPELLDLDAAESAKVGAAAYELVKKVVDAVKA